MHGRVEFIVLLRPDHPIEKSLQNPEPGIEWPWDGTRHAAPHDDGIRPGGQL
jgi:hypothetical protein